jgi:hypothetical protein
MTAKDVLLVLGGVAVGYYAFKMNFMKKTAIVVEEVVSEVKDAVVDTAKVTKCEAEWTEKIGSISRFASNEARDSSKSEYVKNCLSK